MNHARTVGSRSGYLLLEAVLALVILSVSLVAVLFAFRTSLAAARRAENSSIGVLLASEKMAELRSLGPQTLGAADGAYEGEYSRFRWRTVVQPVPDEDLFRAEVEVSWDEGGTTNAARLTSLLAGLGLVGGTP